MKPQFVSLKKASTGRQNMALDRLISATESPPPPRPGSAPAPSVPTTPALPVDANSASPTPVLTMEPNTPQSSSPSSANASALGEVVDDGLSANPAGSKEGTACPEVRVQEA